MQPFTFTCLVCGKIIEIPAVNLAAALDKKAQLDKTPSVWNHFNS